VAGALAGRIRAFWGHKTVSGWDTVMFPAGAPETAREGACAPHCSRVDTAQGLARHWDFAGTFSPDFIDRTMGKVAATAAGMVWNFLWFKYYVYA
jgi:hypothetical protein